MTAEDVNKNGGDSLEFFNRKFDQEILRSEKLRTAIVLILFTIPFLAVLFLRLSNPAEYKLQFQGKLPIIKVIIYYFVLLGFEAVVWFNVSRHIKKGTPAGKLLFIRCLNAVIETSAPTFPILMMGLNMDPVLALGMSPVFMYFHFIILSTLRLDFRLSLLTGIIAGGEYFITAQYLIHRTTQLTGQPPATGFSYFAGKAVFLFLGGVAAGLVANEIRKRIAETFKTSMERNKILNTFGQHVSPLIVNQLLNQKKELESEVRHISVLFLDIRNFTTFCESKKPDEIVDFLNSLFSFMIEIVNNNKGIINKFLGDGFMAVFGAPLSEGGDSYNAVKAALEIREGLKREVEKGNIPDTRIGIGIHAGEAVTGNVGSARRKEYTIIGDTVNLASRIESLNKEYNSEILISETVYEILQRDKQKEKDSSDKVLKALADAEELGMTKVKGRKQAVKIFKIA